MAEKLAVAFGPIDKKESYKNAPLRVDPKQAAK
jgi:hypothetical protein